MQCLLVAGDGFFQPTQIVQHQAEIVVHFGMVGLKLKGLPVAVDRLLAPPQRQKDDRQVREDRYLERRDHRCLPDQFQGLTGLTALMEEHPQHVKSIALVGLDPENLPVYSFGSRQISSLVGPDSLG